MGSGGISVAGSGNSLTITSSTPPFAWTVITAPQMAVKNNGYFTNGGAPVQVSLPVVSAVGDTFAVVAMNAAGWQILGGGQTIQFGNQSTTGNIASTKIGDSIQLTCNVANSSWFAEPGSIGSMTIGSLANNALNINSAGIIANDNAGTFTGRTLTSSSSNLTITNATGVAGNPTFALSTTLQGLGSLSGTGYIVQTGPGTFAERTFQAGSGVSLINADGVSGNTTIIAGSTVPTTFTEDIGTATPSGNNLNVLGTSAQGISTSGSGATVTITASNASSSQKGVASFNATNFTATTGVITSNNFTITAGSGLTGGGALTLGGSTSLSISAPVSVANGGTGNTTLTTNGVLFGNGTSAIGITAQGAANTVLLGNGGVPTFGAVPNAALSNSSITINTTSPITGGAVVALGGSITIGLSTPLSVANGGTGDASFTAYSVITGGTTSTGALQNVSGVGTSGQVLTSNGAGTLPTWQAAGSGGVAVPVKVQFFKVPGTTTYTPTSGMKYCIVEVCGGGGGSGGCASTGATQCAASGGGSGAGYGRVICSAATIGVSRVVTVGAGGLAGTAGNNAGGTGGKSELENLAIGEGGVGGSGSAAYSTVGITPGGEGQSSTAGGGPSTGATNIILTNNGYSGGNGIVLLGSGPLAQGGFGGYGPWGGAGLGGYVHNSTSFTGIQGISYGSGGSGSANSNSASARVGAAGGPGIVIVTEYF